jgi:hypothetical protein
METKETELNSENSMNCEMPNNTDRLTNSDNGKNPCEHLAAGFGSNSELMTEGEVIHFLRIPEISNSKDYHNVIEHLKRIRGLPRIHVCRKALYPRKGTLIDSSMKVVNNFRQQFNRIRRRAGVKKGTFHDFRRTAISMWFANGMGEHDVMVLARHADQSGNSTSASLA